jgi:hypothetical protein
LSIDFENILLSNDLIIVRNQGDEEEDVGQSFRGMEDQQGRPIQDGNQSNSEFQSLTLNPTQPGPPYIQIDAQDANEIRFGHYTYAWKENDTTFPMDRCQVHLKSYATRIAKINSIFKVNSSRSCRH